MLGDHLLEVARLRQAEAPHAVEVALHALRHLPRDGVPGHLADRGVELVVEHGEALVVAVLGDLGLAAHEAGERGDVAGLGARRGKAHRGALERLADELRVLHGRGADPRDERAELGHDLDEALVAQPDQRLAHRRAADREAVGELVLGEALPGGELRGDDRVAQRAVDLPAGGPGGAAPQAVDAHVGHRCILTYKPARMSSAPPARHARIVRVRRPRRPRPGG